MTHRMLPTLAPTTAELLAAFPRIFANSCVRLRDLLRVLGDRGLASALLLLAIPQMLPLPLGVSNLLAVPMALVAFQMAMGRHTLWLPAWVLDRPVPRTRLVQASQRLTPLVARLERLIKPRFPAAFSPLGLRVAGIAAALVAMVSLTPLPLTGWLPGLALIVMALGLMERDGVVVLLGLGIGLTAIAVFLLVITGMAEIGEAVQEQATSGLLLLPAAISAPRPAPQPSPQPSGRVGTRHPAAFKTFFKLVSGSAKASGSGRAPVSIILRAGAMSLPLLTALAPTTRPPAR